MRSPEFGPLEDWLGDRLLGGCPVGPDGRLADVVVVDDPEFGECYLVTSYRAVAEVYRNPSLTRAASFASPARKLNGFMSQLALTMMEGEDRMVARAAITPNFTSTAMEALTPAIRRIAHEAVDDLVQAGAPADLVHHIAQPLPARAVAHVLGVPDVDPYEMYHWASSIFCVEGDQADAIAALGGIVRLSLRMRRESEGDAESFVGRVIAGAGSRSALAHRVGDTIVGGCENSTAFIQTGLIGLLTSGRYRSLCEDPNLVPGAVEELLRVHPPGHFGLLRTAVTDTEVAGVRIPAGASVLPATGIANVDPDVHPDANDCVVESRSRKPHMTFGLGSRYCPGAPLGRLEMTAVLEALTQRLPNLRLAVPRESLRLRRGQFVGGFEEVPLEW